MGSKGKRCRGTDALDSGMSERRAVVQEPRCASCSYWRQFQRIWKPREWSVLLGSRQRVFWRSDTNFGSSGDIVSFEAYLWCYVQITNAPRILLIDGVKSLVEIVCTRYPDLFWSTFIQWTDPDPFRIFF
jgi:hypothetical protein